jgi:hypothetical protein
MRWATAYGRLILGSIQMTETGHECLLSSYNPRSEKFYAAPAEALRLYKPRPNAFERLVRQIGVFLGVL